MRASAIEFRLRMLINLFIILLGFWAPWVERGNPMSGFGAPISLLEWLALHLTRAGVVSFAVAAPLVLAIAAAIAGVGAVLCIWGTAYLGPATVHNLDMKSGMLTTSGPYRFMRNPLYLGLWCMVAAMSFLMPPSGALVAMVLITVFQLRLILGEEAFLGVRLGEPYLAYRHAVPRLIPRFRGAPPAAGQKPQWLRSVLSELTPLAVFVALAFCSWTYDNRLMIRAILIGFGLSLVARAMMLESKAAEPRRA